MDTERLKSSWAVLASQGDRAAAYFYSYLFVQYPEVRELFPASMAGQRDKLLQALGHIVSGVSDLDRVVPYVQALGRDHRKFAITPAHYEQVGEALLATLGYYLGDEWTPDLEDDWGAAYKLVGSTMQDAADAAAAVTPPWWTGTIVEHRRPGPGVAVITVHLDQLLRFWPGQSLSVESPNRPRVWRMLSPANTARQNNTIDFHVRAVAGGELSPALVYEVDQDDQLRIGPPAGSGLILPPGGGPDLLLLAGGTGLAPLKALIEQVAIETGAGTPTRQVDLVVGSRSRADLYDLPALQEMQDRWPWLTVTVAPADEVRVDPATIAVRRGWHEGRRTYLCGPAGMVDAGLEALDHARVPRDQVRYEPYYTGYIPQSMPAAAPEGTS